MSAQARCVFEGLLLQAPGCPRLPGPAAPRPGGGPGEGGEAAGVAVPGDGPGCRLLALRVPAELGAGAGWGRAGRGSWGVSGSQLSS